MRCCYLSGEDEIEQNYHDSEMCVEALAKEEIEKIKKKTDVLKLEAEKVGADVEASLEENESKARKKKS